MKQLTFLVKPASGLCDLRCRYCFYEDVSQCRAVRHMGRMEERMDTTLANRVVRNLPWRSMNKLTRIRPSMMAYMMSPSVVNRDRPGFRPLIIRAESMMATVPSPGMPRVSRGMRVAPVTALLADSAAATPSTEPCPNSSGCLDRFLAVL